MRPLSKHFKDGKTIKRQNLSTTEESPFCDISEFSTAKTQALLMVLNAEEPDCKECEKYEVCENCKNYEYFKTN